MNATATVKEITVFGARGHSLLILRGMEEYWQGKVRVRALIDDIENGFDHPVLRLPVLSSEDRLRLHPGLPVMLTPAATELRARIAARLADEGASLFTAGCPGQGHVDPTVEYGEGCVVSPLARLGPAVRIGKGAQVLSSLVAHDVEIGRFSMLNINSTVLGHVSIGDHVNIAPNAVICNGSRDRPLRIGDGAIVGVGAVVARDVAPGARVVGNPAMPVDRWKAFNRWLESQ